MLAFPGKIFSLFPQDVPRVLLPWPPLLRRLLSGRPGSGAQSYSGRRCPHPQPLWRLRLPRSQQGATIFLTGLTSTASPTPPHQGYLLTYRGRQATFLSKAGAVWGNRTGGACGKLKSKVSSTKGQSWPKVAKQIGKHGDPVKSPDTMKEATIFYFKCWSFQ